MNKDEINNVFWKAFEKSGKPGYFMLYKTLTEDDKQNK